MLVVVVVVAEGLGLGRSKASLGFCLGQASKIGPDAGLGLSNRGSGLASFFVSGF